MCADIARSCWLRPVPGAHRRVSARDCRARTLSIAYVWRIATINNSASYHAGRVRSTPDGCRRLSANTQ